MAKVLDYSLEVIKFELQSHYYVSTILSRLGRQQTQKKEISEFKSLLPGQKNFWIKP